MSEIKTIHIFGFGKTQGIGKEINATIPSNSLNTLEPVISNVRSKLPSEYDNASFHAINIFKDMFVDFIPKRDSEVEGEQLKSVRTKYTEINSELIDGLCSEINSFTASEN